MANTWNQSGTTWGQNTYGTQTQVIISITGVQATSSVGSVEAVNKEGWGRQSYGNSGWGVDYAVLPTGLQATSALGGLGLAFGASTEPIAGQEAETDLGSLTTIQLTNVALTGLQAQSELGSFDNAGTLVGWGRNGFGEEPWGDSFNKLAQLSGVSAASSIGSLTLDLTSVTIPTGQSSTSSVGLPTLNLTSVITPTGQSATTNVGSLIPEIGVPLTGVSATSQLGGIILSELTISLTGQQAASAVGGLTVGIGVPLTGVSTTSSVGSLIPEIGVPLTGLQAASAVGAIAPTAMTVGLTGLEATSEVGTGLILKYFNRLVPKDSTGYTRKVPKNSTGYTRRTA